jgi:hypothetical protein
MPDGRWVCFSTLALGEALFQNHVATTPAVCACVEQL